MSSRVANLAKQLSPAETKAEASISPAPTSGAFSAIGSKSPDDVVVRARFAHRLILGKRDGSKPEDRHPI